MPEILAESFQEHIFNKCFMCYILRAQILYHDTVVLQVVKKDLMVMNFFDLVAHIRLL